MQPVVHALRRTIIEQCDTAAFVIQRDCNSGSYLRIQSIIFLDELWNSRSAAAACQ